MARFFLAPEGWGNEALLEGDEARHLAQVLRAGEGEQVTVFDGRGRSAPAEVLEAGRKSVRLKLGVPRQSAPHEPELLLYRDGVSATVTVERRGETLILKSNGKVEASNQADMPTQVLAALLPILMHEAPRNALLVGLASGVTAGAALQSDLQRLTVVELEPAMVQASRYFESVNHRVLRDPRTRLVLGDAGDRQFGTA